MTSTLETRAATRHDEIVPPAAHQLESRAGALNSTTAGVVVQKYGQLRSEFRSEGRIFARELAKHVNARQAGNATALVFEETFGYEDRLHWLIHLRDLGTYYAMVEMGDQDRAYRDSVQAERVAAGDGSGDGGGWDRLFLDGGMRSTVLLPLDGPAAAPSELNTLTAGIVVCRSAALASGRRSEALDVARELTASLNADPSGEVSASCYEEAFGWPGRLHWLLHLRSLTSWDVVRRNRALSLEGRPGVFADQGREEVALTPHHWGLYATRHS